MGTSIQSGKENIVDSIAHDLQAYFGEKGQNGEMSFSGGSYWYVRRVRLQAGLQPSFAEVVINHNDASGIEAAPNLTVPDSNLLGLKHGTPGIVKFTTSNRGGEVLTGEVSEIQGDLGEDVGLIILKDLRTKLSKMPLIGSVWKSGLNNEEELRPAWPIMFNMNNMPNMIFIKAGNKSKPVFCEPYYGCSDGVPGDPENNQEKYIKACVWTPSYACQYLRDHFVNGYDTYNTKWPGLLPQWPSDIVWPEGLESVFTTEENAQERTMALQRITDRMNAAAALQIVAQAGGPFDIYMGPNVEKTSGGGYQAKNTIAFVLTRYEGGSDILDLERPISGDAGTGLNERKAVTGGLWRESSEQTYKETMIQSSNATTIQTRVAMDKDNPYTAGGLIPAWASDIPTAIETYINQIANDGSVSLSEIYSAVVRKWPSFGRDYRLNPDPAKLDLFNGVDGETGRTMAKVARPVLSHILSSYLASEQASSNITQIQEAQHYRRPVLWERSTTGTSYFLASRTDGMRVMADGTIQLPGLRDQVSIDSGTEGSITTQTFRITVVDNDGTKESTVTIYYMRATLAIPADHGLWTKKSIEDDQQEDTVTDDRGRLSDSFYGFYANKAAGTGKEAIRDESWSIPETITGSVKDTVEVIRDDTNKVEEQAIRTMRDVARLDSGGYVILPHCVWSVPGRQVGKVGDLQIQKVIRAIEITNPGKESAKQYTRFELQ